MTSSHEVEHPTRGYVVKTELQRQLVGSRRGLSRLWICYCHQNLELESAAFNQQREGVCPLKEGLQPAAEPKT